MNTAELTPAGTLTAEDLGAIHLIGVGGVGMSGLARLFLTRGLPVSGSELREWPSLAGLRALGGTIHMSHQPSNLDGVDTVVYSTAIPRDHLALAEARRRGLVTVAMVGYDGGRVAAEGLADHVVVTRSEHIPRIQEAQASAYHVLRELVEAPPGPSVSEDGP